MSLIEIDPQLLERLRMIASEENKSPEEIIEAAVRDYMRWLEHQKIESEAEAFDSMYEELREEHYGEFVAIHNRKVVDHDREFQKIHRRIRQRFGRQPVLIRAVETPERTWTFRGPKLDQQE